ncbi:unnamed protein product, partial [Meganyctiphanes norvegica]
DLSMCRIRCSYSYPAPRKHKGNSYASSQPTIKMDIYVHTECSYHGSSTINTILIKVTVTFSLSPEPHFIINEIGVEPETNIDFLGSYESRDTHLDIILGDSRKLINAYLQKSLKILLSDSSLKKYY